MKEENKKFLKETFNINVDEYDDKTLFKVLELIEAETIKNLYLVEDKNKNLKEELNKLISTLSNEGGN